jgi:hypothetical protein
MAKINKKVINMWDGGIKTSSRSSNPETSDGAQMIKGFDVYKDPKKMIPMQSWTDFATETERDYGIRALGGQSDIIYGVGSALKNWYGKEWAYRIRVDVKPYYFLGSGLPLHLDMSLLSNDFWTNAQADMSDLRATDKNGNTKAIYTENVDVANKTGDMWIESSILDSGTQIFTTATSSAGTGSPIIVSNTAYNYYAYAFPVTYIGLVNYLTLNFYKVGSPSDLTIKLYSDNAGSPNALIATLGTISANEVLTTYAKDYSFKFDNQNLNGTYWIVVHESLTLDADNYYMFQYSGSGTTTLKYASNNTLTSWGNIDTTATPNFTLSYYTNTISESYFYLYYGNPTVEQISDGNPSLNYPNSARNVFTGDSMRWAYTFNDLTGNKYYNTKTTTSETESFTSNPQQFTSGLFGKAIKTYLNTITTNHDDNVGLTSSQVSFSFLIKCSKWENVTLYKGILGDYRIALDTNGKILLTINGSAGTTTNTSARSISLNEWHIIDCVFNDDAYIYIDGVKETFNIDDGNYDGSNTDDGVELNSGNYCAMAQIWGFNNDLTDNQVGTKYNNFRKSDFWTIGSQESFVNISPVYDGVQLYYKLISSGGWKEQTEIGQPVKSLSYYPVNAWVDDTGTYFIVSQNPENQGFMFLAQKVYTDILNPNFLTLSVLTNNPSKIVSQLEYCLGNGKYYFNFGTSAIGDITTPTASATTFGGTVQSLASWRTYLAGAYTLRNRAIVHIWDLATTNPLEKMDAGTGNIRIVGNASDTLFCVVDNFIDDSIKSSNKPTVEIRKYVGNGQTQKTHVLEIPTNITTYDDNWERAVSPFKIKRNNQVLWYMKLPNNEAGTTFDEGFWSIGMNSRGELCLTLQIDTAGLGMPEQVFGFAQQVFFIQKDGGIKRLSDNTYSNTALFKSLKMNEGNTNIEKKLIGFEVITEPLEASQVISLYYKINGDTERTLIGTMSGEGEISREFLNDTNDEPLRNYRELEIEVESTGGKSAILEVNYKYEYTKDII